MGMHVVTIVLVVICFLKSCWVCVLEDFMRPAPVPFYQLIFFSTDPGEEGFQKIAKKKINFTQVS
jgi:hypothetical protein